MAASRWAEPHGRHWAVLVTVTGQASGPPLGRSHWPLTEDLAVLDAYMRASGLPSRSAALQHAIRLLPYPGLEQDYAAAWDEWERRRNTGNQCIKL